MNARLTDREMATLRRVVEGKTNLEIAIELGVGESTIGRRVTWMLFKTGARNRTHLAALAYKNEYLPKED